MVKKKRLVEVAEDLYNQFTDKVANDGSFLDDDILDVEKESFQKYLTNPKFIFDLGTGNGRALPYLLELYNCKIVAIDYEYKMLKLARKKVNNSRVTFLQGDFIDLLPSLEYPDAILCLGTVYCALQRKEKRDAFLKMSFEKLNKNNGLLFLGYRSIEDAVVIENVVHEEKTTEGSIIFFEEEVNGEKLRGSQFYPNEHSLKIKLANFGFNELENYRIERSKLTRNLLVLRAGEK